ncbi:unnamed protein product [Vitrella brassicaformis CCMP3155]|uniref:RimM N-terminal domain-containing protein n=1 Tax=Vitrella brassicaformis (strain CCMP3155) TaxID=1169540 RepID=A0A0G4FCX7_VITBC|nr:unnamed protein product [Vitrella brassicaformis CCMP3155]|eukprot:CEM10773.1 unnamed protein product [Vitrella brassicaformis CCMP3155]
MKVALLLSQSLTASVHTYCPPSEAAAFVPLAPVRRRQSISRLIRSSQPASSDAVRDTSPSKYYQPSRFSKVGRRGRRTKDAWRYEDGQAPPDPWDLFVEKTKPLRQQTQEEEEEEEEQQQRRSSRPLFARLRDGLQRTLESDASFRERYGDSEGAGARVCVVYEGSMDDFVEIGSIMGAHGVVGQVKVRSSTDFPQDRFGRPGVQYLKPRTSAAPQPVALTQCRKAGQDDVFVVQIAGADTREDAIRLTGLTLYASQRDRPSSLDEASEVYVPELLDMQVYIDWGAFAEEDEALAAAMPECLVGRIVDYVPGSEATQSKELGAIREDMLLIEMDPSFDRTVIDHFYQQLSQETEIDGFTNPSSVGGGVQVWECEFCAMEFATEQEAVHHERLCEYRPADDDDAQEISRSPVVRAFIPYVVPDIVTSIDTEARRLWLKPVDGMFLSSFAPPRSAGLGGTD